MIEKIKDVFIEIKTTKHGELEVTLEGAFPDIIAALEIAKIRHMSEMMRREGH